MNLHILTFLCKILLIIIHALYSGCQESNEENVCSEHPSNVIIANPVDCFSFYACQYGNAMKIICPTQSMFNPMLGNCDSNYTGCVKKENDTIQFVFTDKVEVMSEDISPKDNGSEYNSTENSIDNGTTTTYDSSIESTEEFDQTTASTSISTSTSSSNTTKPTITTEDPNICVNCTNPIPPLHNLPQCPFDDTDVPTFLPSESFCDSYFLCYKSEPFELFCSMGFHWNKELNECILERESNCTDSSIGNKVPKCPSIGQQFFPHADRCNFFYYCENGRRSLQQCAAFKHWDINEQTCKIDISARCIKTVPRSQRAKYYLS